MLDRPLVTLSALLLEYVLHPALCVLDDGSLDGDGIGCDVWISAEGVLAGADLVYLRKGEDVTDVRVVEAGDGEEVAGGEEVFSACYGGDHVLIRLGADERERGRGRGRARGGARVGV